MVRNAPTRAPLQLPSYAVLLSLTIPSVVQGGGRVQVLHHERAKPCSLLKLTRCIDALLFRDESLLTLVMIGWR
jgi:hypothetical protein